MPERITGNNTGVGAATDGNGGNNMNNDQGNQQTQGGGYAGVRTTGNTGGGTGGSMNVAPNIVTVKTAIDRYLAKTSFVPEIGIIITIFVDEVLGYKKALQDAKKAAEESEGAMSEQEVTEMVEESRTKMIESLKDPNSPIRKMLEQKVNDLKATLSELSESVKNLSKEVGKMVVAAFMPTMIAPGVPNPAYTGLRLLIDIMVLKAKFDAVLKLTSKALGLIIELGLDKTDMADKVTSLVSPILSLQETLRKYEKDGEAAAATEQKKERYFAMNPATGRQVTYMEIEEKSREWGYAIFPLDKKSIKKIKKKIRKGEDDEINDDDLWGKVILDYNEFLISPLWGVGGGSTVSVENMGDYGNKKPTAKKQGN